ncbi:hypothetical protein FD723_39895 (plasmid) [Nostoc sp. C052]|uniref:hypothetical protein n=1 Tax=Nostoc sp. C052 TaxID=2576902 RepID=UPI0015C3656F|nr:hypothetical protein [Nostoc sp. C052]QLE46376.1 hypothetical protein FD723_39895 [Nostoc sp. C052]
MSTLPIPTPPSKIQFRCLGMISAKYFPSAENPLTGNLEFNGNVFPANIHGQLNTWLRKHPEIDLTQINRLSVYVRNSSEAPFYKFCVVGVEMAESFVNTFSVRGIVRVWDFAGKSCRVTVGRNIPITKERREKYIFKPFQITLYGEMPETIPNYFCDISCKLVDGKLLVESINPIYKADKPKSKKQKPKPKKNPVIKTKKVATSAL